MSAALRARLSGEDFFARAQRQEGRYEFDGFQPTDVTGDNPGYGRLVRNNSHQLAIALNGKAGRSLGPQAGVATIADAVR